MSTRVRAADAGRGPAVAGARLDHEARGAGLGNEHLYALHSRLLQIMSDAVHDGILPRSPCSRRTSPRRAKQHHDPGLPRPLRPDSDEATRTAVEAVLVARADSLRTQEVIV